MSSQDDNKIIYPFGDKRFNDQKIIELDHKYCSGEISFDEYLKRIGRK